MKVVIYARCSTMSQEFNRQIDELTSFAISNKWKVVGIYSEKISGKKSASERPELSKLIEFVKKQKIDKVIISELSRLGRSTIDVLNTIKTLNDNKISLFIKSNGIETLNEKKEVNIMAQFMFTILSEISSCESNQISERMKSGFRFYLQGGGVVGRPKGWRKESDKYLEEYSGVVKLIKQDYPVRKIALLEDVSVNTVQKIKKLILKKAA